MIRLEIRKGSRRTQHFLNPLNLNDRSIPLPLGVRDHFPCDFKRGGRAWLASSGGKLAE